MKTISEALNTPVKGEYDVIVVGGGPAGAVAAISAARAGAKTLIIEKQLYLGGMWTGGLVNPLFDTYLKDGILAELIADHKALNSWGGFEGICFSYENMKRLLEEKVVAAGGELLFETSFSRAITENGRIIGVIAENREGRNAYLGKMIIDCTGDANVAADAGVPFTVGRESDGECQAMTLMFTIGNVSFLQKNCDELRLFIEKALEENDTGYRLPYTRPYIIQIPNSKTAAVQLTHIRGANPFSQRDISLAAIDARKQAFEVVEFLKAYVPEFKDIELLETAPLMGVRESRRIKGEYTLTAADLINGNRFEDEVCTGSFGMDIHDPESDGQTCQPVKRYGIPFRCMIPQGVEGLLVAGRCISGTAEAFASFRVTGNCAAMGEVAGKVAAHCVKTNTNPKDYYKRT